MNTAAPPIRRRGPRALRALFWLAGAYLLVSAFCYCFGDALLFRAPRRGYRDDASITKLRTADGVRISARYLPNPKARYTLLFSHGKGDDLGSIAPFLARLQSWGFAVLAYDYHGYGTSGGRGSEAHAYQDIDAAYDYLVREQHVPPSRIIAYGYSLGGGPTVDLAARREVAGVMLDSTFTSIGRVFSPVRVLPFDEFDNLAKLDRVHYPLLVIHRKDDRVVPFRHGLALYRAAHAPKEHLWQTHGGHEAVLRNDDPQYRAALQAFAAGLRK